jgi:hypothetical protein
MENNEQFAIEQTLQSLNLQQRALTAFDAWCGIQVGQACLKFRQEVSRVLGIYIEDPTARSAKIDGIVFSLNNKSGNLQAWMKGCDGEEYYQDIKNLSDLGDLIQHVNQCDEPEPVVEDQEKYGHIFVSAPEYLEKHDKNTE